MVFRIFLPFTYPPPTVNCSPIHSAARSSHRRHPCELSEYTPLMARTKIYGFSKIEVIPFPFRSDSKSLITLSSCTVQAPPICLLNATRAA